jgi:folate-dependent phosphoribosylglycinamide formyltransferase PurN
MQDKMQTVNGRMLAFSGELGAVLESDEGGGADPAELAASKNITALIMTQGTITRRMFEESKKRNTTNDVVGRVKCDGYDKIISPEELYLSVAQKYMVDNPHFDFAVSKQNKHFFVC